MSRFPWRTALKTVALLLGMMIVAVALLIWRLSEGSMTTSFLTPYIEAGVDRYIPGTHTVIDHTLLSWDNLDSSVTFHADNIHVRDRTGAVIADVPSLDIQLSVFGLVFGQFLPTSLAIDHPHFKLERDSAGVLRFGDMSANGGADSGDTDIKGAVARIADNLAHAIITHRLQIMDTVFDVEDKTSQSNWAVHIPEVSLQRKDGDLEGFAVVDVAQKDQVSKIEVHYHYDREKGLHELGTKLTDITPSFFAGGHPATLGLAPASIFDLPLSGDASIAFDSELNIEKTAFNIQGHDGRINDPDFWDKPLDVKTMVVKVDYDRHEHGLTIDEASFDFGGPTLGFSATSSIPLVPTHDLDFEITAHLDNWPMDQYGALWPKPIISDPRNWIATNLTKGTFDHGEAMFKGELSWDKLSDLDVTEAKGKITASHGRVSYLEGMPAVENVGAEATFDLNQMMVQITGGGIGALQLQPFAISLTDFEKPTQYIDIPLQMTGPVTDVLKLIDAPRLGYAKAIGVTPDDVTGKASGTVKLHFPLLNDLLMKDVEVAADISLTNVASSQLVKGIDLTQGNVQLALDKVGFSLKGPVTLNKVPVQMTWLENFEPIEGQPLKHATIIGAVGDDQWAGLGVSVLGGTKGLVPLEIELTEPSKDLTQLTAKADFTAAEVHLDQLNWKKPATTPAVLKLAVDMPTGKNINITSIDLEGKDIQAKGNATMNEAGDHLLSLTFDPLMAGRTNATLHFTQAPDEDHMLRFDVEGTSLDISGITSDKSNGAKDPRSKSYTINLGKIYTSDTGFITNVKGHAIRDPEGWREIGLQGMADGDHQLNVDLADKNGRRFFNVSCDDFGKALKGMGFTDTVTGGSLDIRGQSTVEDPKIIEGHVKVGSFTVKNLPGLAVLLNATSPFGFAGILTDSADFNSLRGKFKWENDALDLNEVRIPGNSVGMNIEGKIDLNSNNANLRGTLVPFSIVNRFIGAIPLLGDVITGGDGGGVLAVAYTIQGPLSKPDVSVNPVSLLTPGFLRGLFFGSGSDDMDDPESNTGPALAPAMAQPALTPVIKNFNRGR